MDPLEPELHKVVMNCMGARDGIRGFCKAVSALTPLYPLSSPFVFAFFQVFRFSQLLTGSK